MINIQYISQDQLLKSGCLDIKHSIEVVEKSIVDFMNGRIIYPEKTVQVFDPITQNRINILPATLIQENICGVKWVSVFPDNPHKYNKLNVTAVIILSETKTGYPMAFMEGSLVSNLRTAAVSAIAAKYLAMPESKTIGFIGAGENAKMNLLAIMAVYPGIETCFVSSRTLKTEQKFIQDMSKYFPKLRFISCETSHQKAVHSADIIVTATSAQADLLKAKWIKKGAFYSHIGGWEDEYAVPLRASKIICDDWESTKQRRQTISRMYKEKIIDDYSIYANLGEILCGSKPGRENNREFIYFNTVGLSYTDIALAYSMYTKVLNCDNGINLILKSKPLFG